jgi:hypothetical protein
MIEVTGVMVPPGKTIRRSHMNIETSKCEELSESELAGVSGGGFIHSAVCYIAAAADKVRQVVHDAAQNLADRTSDPMHCGPA